MSWEGKMNQKKPPNDWEEPSELEVSGYTEDETIEEQQGFLGKLFRLSWVGSKPDDHDKGRELRRAVRAQDVEKVKKMLSQGVGVNESQEASLACIATRRENLTLLRLLIDASVDINASDRRNKASKSRTPLMEAARKGWEQGVALLLKEKCDLEFADESGYTALHLAVRSGKNAVVHQLLQAGALAAGNPKCRLLPIHEAATPEVLADLLNHGSSMNDLDKLGATCLHHQVRAGRPVMVEHLIRMGSDVNALDYQGRSPIFYLSTKGDTEMVFKILKREGIQLDFRDHDMNSFAHLVASRCIHAKTIEMAFDASMELWSQKNHNGETPYDLVAGRGFHPIAQKIKKELQIKKSKEELKEESTFSVYKKNSGYKK